MCAGPMYGGDHHAGVLAEWAEFQKLMGVTKVRNAQTGEREG